VKFVVINGDAIRAYLGYNIVAIKAIWQFYAREVITSIVVTDEIIKHRPHYV
jgi:hypothetical protein